MTPEQILDWLNSHYTSFRETFKDDENGDPIYELKWLDDGVEKASEGRNIKECVLNATKKNPNV